MKKYIVAFRTANIPPVGIVCDQYTRGERFTQFWSEGGEEIAWFNTCEIGGMWLVNDSPIVGAKENASFIGRKN